MGEPGEFILRRVKKGNPNCVVQRQDGSRRATGFSIQPKPDEQGPSWTHKDITSPRTLLDQVKQNVPPQNPDDYYVCELAIAEVRRAGLRIHDCPTEIDAGHCEIRPSASDWVSKSVWSKLAKETRILEDDEIDPVDEDVDKAHSSWIRLVLFWLLPALGLVILLLLFVWLFLLNW